MKKATRGYESAQAEVVDTVQIILPNTCENGKHTVKRYAEQLDKWTGEIVVPPDEIEAAKKRVPQSVQYDIRFAQNKIRRCAEA